MRTKTNHQTVVKIMLGVLLLLLSASFTHKASNAQIRPASAAIQPPAPPDSDLKVLTWNIRGNDGKCGMYRHMEKVADVVTKHEGLDVIALQEVFREQASVLARILTKRGYGNFESHFVKMKDCGDFAHDFGIALLSNHPASLHIGYPLPHAPDTNPHTGEPCDKQLNRMLEALSISVRGRTVRVYNTHLTACGGTDAQKKQANRIMLIVKAEELAAEKFARSRFRPILVGDMNAPPSRGARGVFLNRFSDAWVGDGGETFPTRDPNSRIDYVFYGTDDFRRDGIVVTPNVRLVSIFNIPGIDKPSDLPPLKEVQPIPDHLPVTAALSYD